MSKSGQRASPPIYTSTPAVLNVLTMIPFPSDDRTDVCLIVVVLFSVVVVVFFSICCVSSKLSLNSPPPVGVGRVAGTGGGVSLNSKSSSLLNPVPRIPPGGGSSSNDFFRLSFQIVPIESMAEDVVDIHFE